MIKATKYDGNKVTTFTADEAADLSNKPVNDPVTGTNAKYGKITMGATFVYINDSGLQIFKFKETTNTWQEI